MPPDRPRSRPDSNWSPESTSLQIDALRDELRLNRLGLRFLVPQVERDYRARHQQRAVPFVRIGMIGSMVAWGIGTTIYLLASPDKALLVVPWSALLMCAVVAFILATTYLPPWRGWMLPSAAFGNALAGLLVTAICYFALGLPEVAVALAVEVAFFGFTIFRFHVALAAPTVFSYIATNQALLLNAVWRGDLSGRMAALYSAPLAIAFVTGLMACAVMDRVTRQTYQQERLIAAQTTALEQERRRADGLLFSIFPWHIAERLKIQPGVIAEQFDEATVVFADLVGFTRLATALSPQDTVARLNQVYDAFDAVAARHGVEKIKTIGDAYMAVVGVPTARSNHADVAVSFALDLRDALPQMSAQLGTPIEVRIGVHSGPVVAGVIGRQKLAYDLWGDSVNTASRMESHGLPGEIQISEATRQRLTQPYRLRARGSIEVKGKGAMRVWLVDRPLPSGGTTTV